MRGIPNFRTERIPFGRICGSYACLAYSSVVLGVVPETIPGK